MKTAVSIPDPVFAQAERLAARHKTTRSDLYTRALSEYLDRHSPDAVTEAMDRALGEVGPQADPFVQAAAVRTLRGVEWE